MTDRFAPLGEYMQVREPVKSPSGKTNVWSIYDQHCGFLGTIAWLGRWRCYVFRPALETVFNSGCMDDLSTFCKEKTQEHRNK